MQKILFILFIVLSLGALLFVQFSAPSETEESAKLVWSETVNEAIKQQRI